MSAAILAFPGVDLNSLGNRLDPRGQSLVVRQREQVFFLTVEPARQVVPMRFASASRARAHARSLCLQFPRIYHRVIDRTPAAGSVAQAPIGGDAA